MLAGAAAGRRSFLGMARNLRAYGDPTGSSGFARIRPAVARALAGTRREIWDLFRHFWPAWWKGCCRAGKRGDPRGTGAADAAGRGERRRAVSQPVRAAACVVRSRRRCAATTGAAHLRRCRGGLRARYRRGTSAATSRSSGTVTVPVLVPVIQGRYFARRGPGGDPVLLGPCARGRGTGWSRGRSPCWPRRASSLFGNLLSPSLLLEPARAWASSRWPERSRYRSAAACSWHSWISHKPARSGGAAPWLLPLFTASGIAAAATARRSQRLA